jgi:hypothetical protein
MAQLIAVCRSDNHQFRRRQLPLAIDDTLTMVVEFTDQCTGCSEHPVVNQYELDMFTKNFRQLSEDEVLSTMQMSRTDILNQLSQLVPCVGCRHSVERLFEELVVSGHMALDPLIVTDTPSVTVTAECRLDTKSLYSLIYLRRSSTALELASKVKKGKRCPLHSLDLHKSKALWTWRDVWDVCTKECQDEITQIDNDGLLVTVEEYLRKHRFCTECKSKVLRAYSILVDEPDPAGVKQDRSTVAGHCRALFREVKACAAKHHVHVPCDEKYLKDLIERAEPELSGNQMERHAKSMEIAQEEVLTCLGVHLHDRFFRIQQKLKVEDKSWQLLFAIGTEGLRRNLEAAFERHRGNMSIDLICRELMMSEIKVQTPKRPRPKKKKCGMQKTVAAPDDDCIVRSVTPLAITGDKSAVSNCLCVLNITKCTESDANHNEVVTSCTSSVICQSNSDHKCTSVLSTDISRCCMSSLVGGCDATTTSVPASHSDLGYSSDGDCESCTSRSGTSIGVESEISHSSGCCSPSSSSSVAANDDGSGACQCDQFGITCRDGCVSSSSSSPHVVSNGILSSSDCCTLSRYGTAPSLEDMLMASEDDSADFEISEDVIRQYRANEHLHAQRLKLRQKLKQEFASMQQRHMPPWNHTYAASSRHVKDATVSVVPT